MKITQFEQSGFILETDNGYKLAMDIGSYTPIEKIKGIKVDAMLVSHFHGDHFSIEQIKELSPKKLYLNRECIDLIENERIESKITEVKNNDYIEFDGIKVKFFDVDHGPNIKMRPKENLGFLIEIDGKRVYFAGDMFYPSGIDVSNIEVDYALIPIGTFYTFGPSEAIRFIKTFKRIETVIPMHYLKTPETKREFDRLFN